MDIEAEALCMIYAELANANMGIVVTVEEKLDITRQFISMYRK